MRRLILSAVLALQVALGVWASPAAFAQEGASVVASGLDAPRAIAFGPNGELYVAEAGRGGEQRIDWPPPFGFAQLGTSGQITRIDGGQKTVVVSGIQSQALGPGGEVGGVNGLAFIGPTLYAVIGQSIPIEGGPPTVSHLVRMTADGRLETVADLGSFEAAANPDQARPDSNPFDLTAGPDGALYVADAGANSVWRVTPQGEVSTVHTWRDNPVPTGLTFNGAGQPMVSFLSRSPFEQGSAMVVRLAPDDTDPILPSLTAAVDVVMGPDGALYVLELSAGFRREPPPPGFLANSGRVLRVTPGGEEVVYAGLNFPTKMAFGPDGSLYVTNNATFVPPGSGEVLRIAVPPLPGGPVPQARDGQSLVTQPFTTREAFQAVWGDAAASRWVEEHNAELARQGR